MSGHDPGFRYWLSRVRQLRDRATRDEEGVCFVEGIRQVLAAEEVGRSFEAVFIDPGRLRSEAALAAVDRLRGAGATIVELSSRDFGRISARDNPVGLAALVNWSVQPLADFVPQRNGLYLALDDVRDPGNLGTLVRTLDAVGGQALIVYAGTDPGHPNALRASLGTNFHLPMYRAESEAELFAWARQHGITTIATSAHAESELWDTEVELPLLLLVGNEGAGLSAEVVSACDQQLRLPMLGTATSLNVSVAAGIILYEIRRRFRS